MGFRVRTSNQGNACFDAITLGVARTRFGDFLLPLLPYNRTLPVRTPSKAPVEPPVASRPPTDRRLLRFTANILGWVAGMGLIVLFWQQLLRSGDEWRQVIQEIDWRQFALATLILFVGQGLRSQLAYGSHTYLRYPFTREKAYRIWFLSQLGKYIPGGVWLLAARVVFYRRHGMPVVVASAATVWEVASIVLTGLALGFFTATVVQQDDWALIIGGGTALLVGMILSLTTFPWRLLARLHFEPANRMLDMFRQLGAARYGLLLRLSLLSLVTWGIIGAGFYSLIASVPNVAPVSMGDAIVGYALAWTVGFLVIFAPAGLGPREAALTLLLAPHYGATVAFAIALLARGWWTLAEGIHILIAAALHAMQTVREHRRQVA